MSRATEAIGMIMDMLEEESQPYEILKDNHGDKELIICVDEIFYININKRSGKVAVSFHVWTIPIYVANAVLRLAKLHLDIEIYSSYIFDDDDNYIDGEEAEELSLKKQAEQIIETFIKDAALSKIANNQNKGKKLH